MTQTLVEPEIKEEIVDGVTRYSVAYPLTREDGQPLLDRQGKPRFTNLVGDSYAEVIRKVVQSNLEVARALERSNQHIETLKRKRTPRQEAPKIEATPLTPEEETQVGLDMQDPRKGAEAVRRVVESVVPPAIVAEVERGRRDADLGRRQRIAREFIAAHTHDYYDIVANGTMMFQYLQREGLEYTRENLEIALAALDSQLAQKPALAPPRNAPPEEQQRNAPPAPAAASTPGNAVPTPGTPPAQTRRPPTGGITNQQATGRPASDAVLSYAQAWDMLTKRPREYEAWMMDPKKNAILTRALSRR